MCELDLLKWGELLNSKKLTFVDSMFSISSFGAPTCRNKDTESNYSNICHVHDCTCIYSYFMYMYVYIMCTCIYACISYHQDMCMCA